MTEAERKIKRAFFTHRSGAVRRGIPFLLTFEQWWELWAPHWIDRGRGRLKKCMCRFRDEGGYEMGNVRIATNLENMQEAGVCKRVRRVQNGRHYTRRESATSIVLAQFWQWRDVFKEYDEESLDTI